MFEALEEEEKIMNGSNLPGKLNADIIVVGSGAAALAAAITAKSKGASVIMLEKADKTGGTTARSGGGYWIPMNELQSAAGYKDNKEDALRYMARYSYPHLYNPEAEWYGLPQREYELLDTYCSQGHAMVAFMEQVGALHSMLEINWTGKPQVDYQDHLPENKGIRGRSIYPKTDSGEMGMGTELIRQLEGWARGNGIEIVTSCEVTSILQDEGGAVTGVLANANGESKRFEARKGVIFGSGGYSHNAEYMLQFQRGPHYGGCAVPTNTGDFITMAGFIGARIGNTAGAFRAQSMIEAALAAPKGSSNVFYLIGDSMILVNKYGKRVVDEKRNYTDRTMCHFVWDAQKAEWSNMLTFMIFDERAATLWQGFPPFPVQKEDGELPAYLAKAESIKELAQQIKTRLAGIAAHTGGFALDDCFEKQLNRTIDQFNGYARAGYDPHFHRGEYAYDREWTTFPPTVPGVNWPEKDCKNYTMHPISGSGPYYGIILAAGTLDTNGGPVINANAQVLDWNDHPITGLYGAGNCIASPTANAYWGAGSTIGPALTFGYIAALHALEAL